MNSKPMKIAVLVGLMLALATWQLATAKANKDKKGKKTNLPAAATTAIKKVFPRATVNEVQREEEGLVLYEVELELDGEEIEVEVTPDGQIVKIEKRMTRGNLPKAVKRTLARLAGNAEIKDIERAECYAVVKLVKLDKPKIVYEVEFIQDGKEVEIKISEDGKFLGKEIEDKSDNDNDDDDHDEENERAVLLDQVPAAVKATILREAGKNKIEEIEKETRGGKRIYEAEWVVGDEEIEIKVASDGTLLSKETAEADDDD